MNDRGNLAVIFLITMIIGAIVGAWLWPYTLNTWLIYLGKTAKIVWWHGVLLGFCPYIGHITIPVAAVTWILMLFLV